MDKRVKKMWIKALRSGDYTQTCNSLCFVYSKTDHRFCCLGVLTNLYAHEKNIPWDKEHIENRKIYGRHSLSFQDQEYSLPEAVREWAQLPKDHYALDYLIDLNDDYNKSFNSIANFIEKKL